MSRLHRRMCLSSASWVAAATCIAAAMTDALVFAAEPLPIPGNRLASANLPSGDGLILGDEYTILAERQNVRQKFTGELVKSNDRWIVLRNSQMSRSERGVPILSSLPGLGRKFRSSDISHVDEFLWIPRGAATVEKHTPAENHRQSVAVAGETPSSHVICTVQYAAKGKSAKREGSISTAADDAVTLAVRQTATVPIPVPVLGNLPLVGSHLHTTKIENRFVKEKLPQQDILCIHVPNFEHICDGHCEH